MGCFNIATLLPPGGCRDNRDRVLHVTQSHRMIRKQQQDMLVQIDNSNVEQEQLHEAPSPFEAVADLHRCC